MEQDHGGGRVDHAIGEHAVKVEVDDHRCVGDVGADAGQYPALRIAFCFPGHGAVHAVAGAVDIFGLADLGEQFVDEAVEGGLDDEAITYPSPGGVGGDHFYRTVFGKYFDDAIGAGIGTA